MRFQDWFDVYNVQHLRLFNAYKENGFWDFENVVMDGVVLDEFSVKDITYKLANAWLNTMTQNGGDNAKVDAWL